MKKLLFLSLIIVCFQTMLFGQNLPQPENNQLYTEFVSKRTAPYLKKGILGTGYIVMDGKEKILFKQEKPLIIEVRKQGIEVTFKRGNMEPINIDLRDNDIMFIFADPKKLNESFFIKEDIKGRKTIYRLTPKTNSRIKEIYITASGNSILTLELYYKDRSLLSYTFSNTKTGVKPDESLF